MWMTWDRFWPHLPKLLLPDFAAMIQEKPHKLAKVSCDRLLLQTRIL